MADLPDKQWRKDPRAKRYIAAIEAAAKQYGIPAGILGALIHRESKFDENALSPSGAIGIAQIVPKFHPGVNPRDPLASINYAGLYLAQNLKRFGNDMPRALAAYNRGPTAIASYGKQWRAMIPPETRNYVDSLASMQPVKRSQKLQVEALRQ